MPRNLEALWCYIQANRAPGFIIWCTSIKPEKPLDDTRLFFFFNLFKCRTEYFQIYVIILKWNWRVPPEWESWSSVVSWWSLIGEHWYLWWWARRSSTESSPLQIHWSWETRGHDRKAAHWKNNPSKTVGNSVFVSAIKYKEKFVLCILCYWSISLVSLQTRSMGYLECLEHNL